MANRYVEYMRLDQIERAEKNPKDHSSLDIQRSIAEQGFGEPPLLDERTNRLLAGHGRLDACLTLHSNGRPPPEGVTVDHDGMWQIPVVRGMATRTDEHARAYLIASNSLTTKGGWDTRELADMLVALQGDDLLPLTGYDDDDLAAMLAALDPDEEPPPPPPALTDPDDAPGFRTDTVTQPGDLWLLGPHRLAVGDSTDTGTWDRLLGGDKADCVWTDPPYGVSYQADLTPEQAKKMHRRTDGLEVANDKLTPDQLADFLRSVFALAMSHTRPGACWYVASPPGPLTFTFGQALIDLEVLRQTLIWVKDSLVMGHSDYHYRHEPVYYGWTPGAAHHPPPDRKQDTIHEVARPKRSKDHPTMKPVELIVRHLENSTDYDDLVVDPFGGSGSTLIACHTTGRRAALIELDPKYADVILRRYQEHTGTVPTRDGIEHDFADREHDEAA